jgi:ribonucleoside-triphosphate reductase
MLTGMGCRSFLTVDRFSDKFGNIANAKNYVEGKHKYWGRLTNVVKPSLNDVNARKSGVGIPANGET